MSARSELEFRIEKIELQMERARKMIEGLLDCKHHQRADSCAGCKGVTELNLTVEEVAEELRSRELLAIEIDVPSAKSGRAIISPKTVIGLGIGAAVFGGFVVWRGGRFVWQLIKQK